MLDVVRDNALEIQHDFRTGRRSDSIGMLLLKPDSSSQDRNTAFFRLIERRQKLLTMASGELATSAVCALYYSELQHHPTDRSFGIGWRNRFVDHMTTRGSTLFVVNGIGAEESCLSVKRELRHRNGKLDVAVPHDENEFYETIIKNTAHSVDTEHIEPALWVLPEMFNELDCLVVSDSIA